MLTITKENEMSLTKDQNELRGLFQESTTDLAQIKEWYDKGTTVVASIDVSEDRFVGIRDSVKGVQTAPPTSDKYGVIVSIDNKEYRPFYVKAYSHGEEMAAKEFSQIFAGEIQKEINKEAIRKLIEYWSLDVTKEPKE